MSLEQVGRLEDLLARVQQNREHPRLAKAVPVAVAQPAVTVSTNPTPVGMPAPAAQHRPAMPQAPATQAAPSRPERERAVITEEHVQIPDRMSMPQARPAPARAPMPSPIAERASREPTERSVRDMSAATAATASASRRRERTSTPLEMAVEGELHRGTPVDLGAPVEANLGGRRNSITEPALPAADSRPTPADGLEMPLTFEPEPVREGTRPIAQIVSKHAPQVDATFGAMLKRSLSLRPH
jgi:hypothetical protein